MIILGLLWGILEGKMLHCGNLPHIRGQPPYRGVNVASLQFNRIADDFRNVKIDDEDINILQVF